MGERSDAIFNGLVRGRDDAPLCGLCKRSFVIARE
jgi:hypothetical protein